MNGNYVWTYQGGASALAEAGKWYLLRTLMNVRPPIALCPELLEFQDRLLSAQRNAKGATFYKSLRSIQMGVPGTRIPFADRLVLWHGDFRGSRR